MNADLQLLQSKLTDFGLNPKEWILETQNRVGNLFHLRVRNHREHDLILMGWAEAGGWLLLSYQG
jgi:hypothetical protein